MITAKFLVGLGAMTMLAGPAAAVNTDLVHVPPSISVEGQGRAYSPPDQVTVDIGVVTQAPAASKALSDNTESMSRLLKTISAHGIADRDVQTDQFSISPYYSNSGSYGYGGGASSANHEPKLLGYRVTNDVRVKVRKISELGGLLDAVVENGANTVNNVSFSIEDLSPLLDGARKEAMSDARRKAQIYAEAGGVHLGKVLYVTENNASGPVHPGIFRAAVVSKASEPVPIASGAQELTVTATVVFALE
jgi:hypothetical protein